MGFQQLTLNANNFSHNSTISSGDFSDIAVTSPGKITFSNSDTDFAITHTFDSPQILTKLIINFVLTECSTHYLVQVSQDGENYTTIETVSDMGESGDQEYLISQSLINPVKYKSFRFSFTEFADSSTTEIESITAFIPNNLNKYSYKDYNVEFDDSLLDMASWKNPRYEGSKLTGTRINYFTEGDTQYPYGLKPVIENKVCALFVANSVQNGGVATSSADPLVEIKNHSYVTIDAIILCNLENNKVTKISHEQFNETEAKKESFRRMIVDNFPEGSKIVTKIINNVNSILLKESHRVKFNQGLLMKLYAYTANTQGVEDGVFGGYGVRDQKGTLTNNIASGSSPGGGMFGFGMTTHSINNDLNNLFTSSGESGVITIDEAPSELSLYGNSLGTITSLCATTASTTPPTIDQASFFYDNFTKTP